MSTQKLTVDMIATLKDLLKKKGHTYGDLAKHLNLSVPAIKRVMTSDEISFSRVLAICEFLDISLEDVLQIQSANTSGLFTFTEQQEEFFSKNPTYLAYFFELYNEKLSPQEIEKKHHITSRSSEKYLKKLESLGLIQQEGNGKLKLNANGIISWNDHGLLGNTFSRQMILSFCKWATDRIAMPEEMFVELQGLSLTKENFSDFKKEYKELATKYRQISAYNRKIMKKNMYSNISIMTIADEWEEKMFRDVMEL